jgi:hypothetical protein
MFMVTSNTVVLVAKQPPHILVVIYLLKVGIMPFFRKQVTASTEIDSCTNLLAVSTA